MTDLLNQPSNSQFKFSREKILAFTLILPSLILVFITYLYPAIFTFVISFAEYDIIRLKIKKFIQFKNFEFLISNYFFTSSVLRTIYFGFLICVCTTILSFLIALLLNEKFIEHKNVIFMRSAKTKILWDTAGLKSKHGSLFVRQLLFCSSLNPSRRPSLRP